MDDRIIIAKIEAIRQRAVRRSESIAGWSARTGLHRAPETYEYDGDWRPVAEGATWAAGRTLFLRARSVFPDTAQGEKRILSFDLRFLEGLLAIDGVPFCGVDREHTSMNVAVTGSHDMQLEFLCVPDSFHSVEARKERAELRAVQWRIAHGESLALAWDVQFAWEAIRTVPDARRRALISAAVEKTLLAIDLTAEREAFEWAVTAARELLRGMVGAIGGDPEEGMVHLTGHSHIDTAWLWPLRETVRKCGRTFSTACRLLEEYPNYVFSCSQPQLYAYTKEFYPTLYEQIRHWISEGRWECGGGMWVEADCNVPSGESLIRQILHGLAFFAAEFGVRPHTCWLPDVFGYPASLPGILLGCGLTSFFTTKLHWQARNPFPAHLFWWEGIDGSAVLAHIPDLKANYNGTPNPEQLRIAWDKYAEKGAYQELLMPFGFGDGGGGPTPTMLEFADRAGAFPGVPRCRQGPTERFFDDVARSAPELPTWVGELYLETHRGTYTTQSAIKRANRKNEILLGEAELACSLRDMMQADSSPEAWRSLRHAWEMLLLLQFHDILPGSSIGEVYTEALKKHHEIHTAACAARDAALTAILPSGPDSRMFLFNALSWERSDPVEVTIRDRGETVELTGPEGEKFAAQVVDRSGDNARIVFVPPRVPGIGYTGFEVTPALSPRPSSFLVEGTKIETPFYSLQLAPDGSLSRLYDKAAAREVLAPGEQANRLMLYQDGPEHEAAWNIHAEFEKREYSWDAGTEVAVVEDGPVRLVVRRRAARKATRLEQDMILWAAHPRIDWITRVDWHERQTLLKAVFPLAVRAENASYEIQFGVVRRPTHRNTSWEQEKFEVCAHRWMDLWEPGYGVSVLNDSRYGCDVHGHTMRLTLLRGAEWPDPEADQGRHELSYSLFPRRGEGSLGETVRRAAEINAPMQCRGPGSAGTGDAPHRMLFSIQGTGILSALKRADNGDGWIVRIYEPQGGRGTATITTPRAIASLVACNHVEEDQEPIPIRGASFTIALLPFQVRSFRLRF